MIGHLLFHTEQLYPEKEYHQKAVAKSDNVCTKEIQENRLFQDIPKNFQLKHLFLEAYKIQ